MPPKKKTVRSEEAKLAQALKENTKVLREVEHEVEQKGKKLLSRPRRYVDSFLNGMLSGLGVLAAAVIVIPILIALLRNVQWIPFFGDAVTKIIEQVEQTRSQGGADDQ